MTHKVPVYDPDAPILVVDVGNTNTSVATWTIDRLKTPLSVPTDNPAAFEKAYQAHVGAMPGGRPAATVIGSVVPAALSRIREYLDHHQERKSLVIGEQVPLPIEVTISEPHTLGTDRACAAAAAYDRIHAGCTIVGFGTAVTVDFVDDEGVLRGGAILPGLRMQLRALHEFTAQLPLVGPAVPPLPYGRNTVEAIQTGVCRGLAGAVRGLVEGYATALNRWPQVVATGGDLAFLAPYCEFLDTLVDHLVLRGVALAYRKHMESVVG